MPAYSGVLSNDIKIDIKSSGAGATVLTGTGPTVVSYTGADRTGVSVDLSAASTSSLVTLTSQADSIIGSQKGDIITAGDGADTVLGGSAGRVDVIYAGKGNDLVFVDGGSQVQLEGVSAKKGDELRSTLARLAENLGSGQAYGGYVNQAFGNEGDDTLVGSVASDRLSGDDGNDLLVGGAGGDGLLGGNGNDTILGGTGSDNILGGAGNDVIFAEDVAEQAATYRARDNVVAGDGDDIIQTSANLDLKTVVDGSYDAGAGNDLIVVTAGFGGVLVGGQGNDTIDGSRSTRSLDINGGAGSDSILGGSGADSVISGGGADSIDLGAGDDVVTWSAFDQVGSDAGWSTLIGGAGKDKLRLNVTQAYYEVHEAELQALLRAFPSSGSLEYTNYNFYDHAMSAPGGGLTWSGFEQLELYVANVQIGPKTPSTGTSFGFGQPSFGAPVGDGDDVIFASQQGVLIAPVYDMGVGNDVFIGSLARLKDYPAATVQGGVGNDTLIGGILGDSFAGGEGDDVLAGNDGDDRLDGGTGRNRISGGAGNDTLTAAEGSDFSGGDGNDLIIGAAGTVVGRSYNDTISGDGGADTILGTPLVGVGFSLGYDMSQFGRNWTGNDLVSGGDGNDLIWYGTALQAATLNGDNGDDSIAGGDGNDVLQGGAGADCLVGSNGQDTLDGGGGNDILLGGSGDDVLNGGGGADTLLGQGGNDKLGFSQDKQVLVTDKERVAVQVQGIYYVADLTDFYVSSDFYDGGDGRDTLVGSTGSDWITTSRTEAGGKITNDVIVGIEQIDAGGGNDVVDMRYAGTTTNLVINGGEGNDLLLGGIGDDTLVGGIGNDTLFGSAGNDQFVFSTAGASNTDTIYDFVQGKDTILFVYNASEARPGLVQSVVNGNVVLTAGNQVVTLTGVGPSGFNADTSVTWRQNFVGGSGNDLINGTAGGETILGLGGDDTLNGNGGNDSISGGDGNDWLWGGNGATLDGGAGTDYLVGGGVYLFSKDKSLTLGDSVSYVQGGTTVRKSLAGYAASNDIYDGLGFSTLVGTSQNDYIASTPGVSTWGNTGSIVAMKRFEGGAGNDVIVLGGELDGGIGDDLILASSADDTLIGGLGNDTLSGGAGADQFVFRLGDGAPPATDLITDFDWTKGDRLVFVYNPLMSQPAVSQSMVNGVLTLGLPNETISLVGNTLGTFDAAKSIVWKPQT